MRYRYIAIMKGNTKKKNIIIVIGIVLTLILALGNTLLFQYGFEEWIAPLYAAAVAVYGALAFILNLIYLTVKEKKHPVLHALMRTALYLAVTEAATYGINNLLLNGKHPHAATAVVTFGTILYFALLAFLTAKRLPKAKTAALLTDIIGVIIVFCITVIPLIQNPVPLTKKQANALQPTPTGLSIYTQKERPLLTHADLYVAPDGSDEQSGSFEHPLATIEKARDLVREIDKTGRNGVTVAVQAGEYRVHALRFTAEDGGTEDCPVTWAAYGDGEVIFNGGVTLDPALFSPVTDEGIRSRLSGAARDSIMCVDLSAIGITQEQYGKLYAIGSYNTANKYTGDWTGALACELFFNDSRCTLARYPNDGAWLTTGKVIQTGNGLETDGDATKTKTGIR